MQGLKEEKEKKEKEKEQEENGGQYACDLFGSPP